jgi:hypothetical protein
MAGFAASLLVFALSAQVALGCWTGYINNCGTKQLKCPWSTSAGYGVKHYPTDLTSCSGVTVTCSSDYRCQNKESACGICYIEPVTKKVVLMCTATSSSVDSNDYWGASYVQALCKNTPGTSSCANPSECSPCLDGLLELSKQAPLSCRPLFYVTGKLGG